MKCRVVVFILAAILCVGGSAFAQKSGMAGGSHDLRITQTNGPDWCRACHTPHAANTAGLLWSRTASSNTYTTWTGVSGFQGGTATVSAATSSGACLSCHDGTVAMNSLLVGVNGSTWFPNTMITGSARLGGTTGNVLTSEHPVGFSYDTSYTAKGNLATVANVTSITGGLKLFGGANNMECGSCHDPHSSTGSFLRKVNTASALCLTCHI
jgi:predicted CXXCH cytochrome family protein